MMLRFTLLFLWLVTVVEAAMPRVEVRPDGRGFRLAGQTEPWVPWGFNYDHDHRMRLLEDYWIDEWETVAGDFREMKALGANVVRVHLQFARFMQSRTEANPTQLQQLAKLLRLAEETGLYLDLTGLGCYHKQDVPAWYDALPETGRWDAQARFWSAVAKVGATSPAVFCYDLMNEPVVAVGKGSEWLGAAFGGKYFTQRITLDQAGRPRPEIAQQWIKQLADAVRAADPKALVTVGLVDWSLERHGMQSGFTPEKIAADLDFLCVHLYPRQGKIAEDLVTLAGFHAAGKPVVIEEVAPLMCGMEDFRKFISASKAHACGWISFYWGQPAEQLDPKIPAELFMRELLAYFQQGPPR